MSARALVAALTLFASLAFSAQPQKIAPPEPFVVDGMRAHREHLRSTAAARRSTAFSSVTVSDAAGDFLDAYFFNQPTAPPTGTTATVDVPPWFVTGYLSSAAAVYAYFEWDGQYHSFEIPLNLQGFTMTPPPPDVAVPIQVTQLSGQPVGNVLRLTFTLSAAMPASNQLFGFGFWAIDENYQTVAQAESWNYPGFGFQTVWSYPDQTAFGAFRKPWHDIVSTTVRQTAARTREIEIVTSGPVPTAAPSSLADARFNVYFYDFEDQFTDTIFQAEATPTGWDTRLLTLGGFWGEPVVELAPPVISGNRITATIPLDPIPVRNQFKFYLAVRMTLNTEVGEVYTSDIDYSPEDGIVEFTLTDPPEIVVSSFPGALLQATNAPGATTTATLTNAGDTETSITLAQQGDFFTLSPAAFPLGAGQSQIVTITGTAKPAGTYAGTITPSGLGVPEGLTIPVTMLVAAPPTTGEAKAQATDNRVDVTANAEQATVPGSASFKNVGTAPLTGLVVADVPWLTIPTPLVTIQPGQTGAIAFTIERAKRNDAHDPLGSATGSLALQYLSGSGAGAAAALLEALADGVPVSKTLITVTDTAKPRTTQGDPGPIREGEIAYFLASVGHVTSTVGTFVSDVQVSSLSPLPELTLVYTPLAQPLSASRSFTLSVLSSTQPLGFADFTRTVFDQETGFGTLQIRGFDAEDLDVSASVFNKSNAAGTYGSAIPALRSDRAIAAGERLFIPGVIGTSAAGRTNLMVQETSGNYASVTVSLLDANGTVIATIPKSVEPFQHWRENTFAPAGAVAATVSVDPGSTGKVLAYATPVDANSGDTWVVTDWPRVLGYDAGARQIVPIAGRVLGGNNNFFRTSLAITNRGTAAANVIVKFYPGGTSKTVTINPSTTSSWSDLLKDLLQLDSGLGYLDIDPQGAPVVVTSRTFATIADAPATFGTAVPAVPAAAMTVGDVERISGFDDADVATINAKLPATFRTNFGLVETAGKSATVRLTLHFRHPQGTRLTVVGSASKEITIGPNEFYFRQFIAQELLGTFRQSLQGNLKDLFLEVEVISGEGSVIGFTSSVDNGSSDQLFKLE